MTSYLLKGGIVTTYTKENVPRAFKADVLVEGSTITAIGENLLSPSGAQVIDCQGRWIAPGMVDTHRYDIILTRIQLPAKSNGDLPALGIRG